MRWILRQLLFHLSTLLITVYLIPGFSIGKSLQNIAVATGVLAAINVFIKPIVKIFFLPLNIITLNLFSFVINMGIIFALTKLVPTVEILTWEFSGFTISGFVVPSIHFSVLYTYLIVSILITTTVSILNWLVK